MKIIFDFNRTLFDPKSERLFEGVEQMLKGLSKKHNLYLITTETGNRASLIRELNINGFFTQIVFTPQKSESDFTNVLQGEIDAIVVGDMQDHEIRIGNSLGLTTVLIGEVEDGSNIQPTHTIKNIRELSKIIQS